MPFEVRCPRCQDTFTVPDLARGKQVRCDQCRHSFTAGGSSHEEPPHVVPVVPVVEAPVVDAAPAFVRAEPRPVTPRRRFEEVEDLRHRVRRMPIRKSRVGLWIGLGIAVTALIVVLRFGLPVVTMLVRAKNQSAKAVPGATKAPAPPPRTEIFVKPFAQRVHLGIKSDEFRDVFFSDAATHHAAVLSGRKDFDPRVECYDLDIGVKLSEFSIALATLGDGSKRMAFSPEGTRFALENVQDDVVIRATGSGRVVASWRPYGPKANPDPGDRSLAGNLARIDFLAEDRVLTTNKAGGIDLWSLPDAQSIYHRPSRVAGPFLDPTWGLALSPDRKTLAIFNGAGFDLMDAAKGDLLCKTGAIPKVGTIHNAWGAEFSPDSRQLAAVLTVQSDNRSYQALATWDIPTGQFVGNVQLAKVPAGTIQHCAWFGTTHVAVFGGFQLDQLIELATGQAVLRLEVGRVGERGRLQYGSCDGQLWYTGESGNALYLIRPDLPEAELRGAKGAPDRTLLLAAEGLYRVD
jgi:hypothetical protein